MFWLSTDPVMQEMGMVTMFWLSTDPVMQGNGQGYNVLT